MIKVVLKQLRSRKQLREIECQKVVSASFEDEKEKYFTITFQSDDGKLRDLQIVFETRSPRVFISNSYTV